jgi:molybdopterin synthase catalytic subunit
MSRVAFAKSFATVGGDIDLAEAVGHLASPEIGGTAVFVGTVRAGRNAVGVAVSSLWYDVYDAATHGWLDRAATAIELSVGTPLACRVVQRRGRVPVGATALVAAVGAPHRREALDGCALLVEALKYESPVWKAEMLADGTTDWVACDGAERASENMLARRQ